MGTQHVCVYNSYIKAPILFFQINNDPPCPTQEISSVVTKIVNENSTKVFISHLNESHLSLQYPKQRRQTEQDIGTGPLKNENNIIW